MTQQFLMQFSGALNRRRAYSATHPMVLAAEERLYECLVTELSVRESFALGVAKDELLIDGVPHVAKGNYARELASRLHRRGVGAITFERGILLTQLSDLLAWLAAERDFLQFAPTIAGGVHVTTIGYDHLVLDDTVAAAEGSISQLWRTLAALAEAGITADGGTGRVGTVVGHKGRGTGTGTAMAGDGSGTGTGSGIGTGTGSGIGTGHGPERPDGPTLSLEVEQAIDDAVAHGAAVYVDGELTGVDSDAVLDTIRGSLNDPAVARRTAIALADLAASAKGKSQATRDVISRQLNALLGQLGATNFAPILHSLNDRASRSAFIADMADALPLDAVVTWMQSAAAASEQQMSHQILRIMTKLSAFAETTKTLDAETQFRDAARDLVKNWTLADPNPTEHVELLDRIASFERQERKDNEVTALGTSVVETSRIVEMALELDFAGEDTAAAANSLAESGAAPLMLDWCKVAGPTRTAMWLYDIAVSEKSVKQLLLTEPVDRLKARALLEVLQPASAPILLDVLEHAEARGTRMIVRQRLAEFGAAITPLLLARLDDAPWFLVRNILTLLQEIEGVESTEGSERLMRLIDHPQVQVRTEALRVLLAGEHTRDAAVRRALRDPSERLVILAIQSVAELAEEGTRPSQSVLAQLMLLVDVGAQSDPVRARAVRVVGAIERDDIRDWLVSLVSKRTPFLRRLKLVEPTQTAATALQLLQKMYSDDATVAKVLKLAAKAAGDTRWQVREITPERLP